MSSKKRHDHRQSLWIVCGGLVLWCYQCGAWRLNTKDGKWYRPVGVGGENPAMKEGWKE
jgi:hypothetical protein